MVNLWSNSYGIGVQSNTQYYRSANRFSWFRGGAHNNTENNPGVGGTVAMTLDSSSNLAVTGNVSATAFSGDGSGLTGVTAGSLANSVTFNNGGGGAASGGSFNGAAGLTVSWNTIGAVTTNNTNQTIAGVKTFSSVPVISATTGTLTFANSGVTKRGILGTVGDNDQWFFGGGATATNAGFLEIATGDDGTEPIHVRQYSGGTPLTGTITRTLTLLDASGNSSFPGTITGNGSGLTTLNASNLTTGTVAGARLGGNQTIAGIKTHTGLVRGRVSSVVTALSSLTADTPSFDCAEVPVPNSGIQYAPMIHGRSILSGAGFRQHVSMGHKRVPSAWGDFYIAAGGNDSFPTREWLFNGFNGNFTASGEVTAFSDARLKENIEVIADPLTKILSIRGVTFTRNDLEDKETRHMGVIAQEVEQYFPEVVHTTSDGTKTVNYGAMAGAFIEAFKEQQSQIDELREMIKKLMDK
jgi:hypothetical protein